MDVRIYTAFGDRVANTVSMARTAYAGAVSESDLPWYLLGLRFYLPSLRRFISADAASPFDAGGFNRYAYCSCDPVNRIDPSGNASFGWLGKLLGNLGGAVGSAARTVAQATPTSALMAISSVAQTLSAGTTIAAVMAAKDGSPAAGILGLIAGASGVAGVGLGVAGQLVSKSVRARRRSGMRSDSARLAAGATRHSEMRGKPNAPSTKVTKTTLVDPGNRVVVHYKGAGLQNMSALRGRLYSPAHGMPLSVDVDTVKWINNHNGDVVGFDTEVSIREVVNTVRDIDKGNAGKQVIRLFGGVHGNDSGLGDNWNGDRYAQHLRDVRILNTFKYHISQMNLSSMIDYQDMARLDDVSFMKMLTEDEAINILGWCYSIADEKTGQARMTLGEREPFYRYQTYFRA